MLKNTIIHCVNIDQNKITNFKASLKIHKKALHGPQNLQW